MLAFASSSPNSYLNSNEVKLTGFADSAKIVVTFVCKVPSRKAKTFTGHHKFTDQVYFYLF